MPFWRGRNCLTLPNACQEAPRVLCGGCQEVRSQGNTQTASVMSQAELEGGGRSNGTHLRPSQHAGKATAEPRDLPGEATNPIKDAWGQLGSQRSRRKGGEKNVFQTFKLFEPKPE